MAQNPTPSPVLSAAQRTLLTGVSEVIAPGAIPGPLAVWGKNTVVLMTGKENSARLPLIAAAVYGRGRVVAVGHGGFFGAEALQQKDNRALVRNLAVWTGGGRPNIVVVENSAVADWLQSLSLPVTRLTVDEVRRAPEQLRSTTATVLFVGTEVLDGNRGETIQRELSAFVERGGGVVLDGLGWGWKQLNPGKSLDTDHGGNRFLYPMGIAFADGYFDRTGKNGWLADAVDQELAHAQAALRALDKHAEGSGTLSSANLAQVTQVLSTTMSSLPVDDREFAPRVKALCAKHGGEVLPTREKPVTASAPFTRLAAVLYAQEWQRLPISEVKAHPSAISFPGAVPAEAKRISRTIVIDTKIPQWHSTGLYVAPGEMVTITVPSIAVQKGLGVRIGAHTDTLWHLPKWERFPEISLRRPLDSTTVQVASPFGGALFIDVAGKQSLGTVSLRIENVVEAPLYVRGKTDLATWKQSLRNTPAPWAELVGKSVILTVPSSVVRDLDDPEALMTYWDEVMDRCYELYATRRRTRPERYCVDRQISAGYMHSGYPIMTGDDVANDFVNLAMLRSPQGKVWGFYHEMGHNFQEDDWTFDGTGEVTNNLFSLYGFEKLNGVATGGHPNVDPAKMEKRFQEYRAKGAKFSEWKSDPFLALSMYVQIQKAFGWEPFIKVFAEYRDLPAEERPKTDQERRNQWLVRLSRSVGKNLSPFFTLWGVPVSESAKQSLNDLPVWLPETATK
jgi:hypothetical protein